MANLNLQPILTIEQSGFVPSINMIYIECKNCVQKIKGAAAGLENKAVQEKNQVDQSSNRIIFIHSVHCTGEEKSRSKCLFLKLPPSAPPHLTVLTRSDFHSLLPKKSAYVLEIGA